MQSKHTQVEVVIGANYGDEGKGMLTEHICRTHKSSVVVMSNGGAQRGHTVNSTELGIRHVFRHFGSGTLLNVPTIMSSTFLLNPVFFVEEHQKLRAMGFKPSSYRARSCAIQLPSDMFICQQLEAARSKTSSKHGSCGMGIWETKVRNAEHKQLLFEDFAALPGHKMVKVMMDALDWQLEHRARDIDIDKDLLDTVRSQSFCDHFTHDVALMASLCKCLRTDNIYAAASTTFDTIVVENAQGLLLDKKYAPVDENGRTDVHSTPSKTGLEGALDALGCDLSLDDMHLSYVSRSYLTRHGNGPFPEYDASMSFPDKTNVFNEHQGSMRFGKLDVDKLVERVEADSRGSKNVDIIATHMNEIDNEELRKVSKLVSYEDSSRAFLEVE